MIRTLFFEDRIDSSVEIPCNVDVPSSCPLCHAFISPIYLGGYVTGNDQDESLNTALFQCPACFKPFMVTYHPDITAPVAIAPTMVEKRIFSNRINSASESFQELYHHARVVESNGLTDLAGVAYRKALEFLIKDYLIYISPDSIEAVHRCSLSQCINMLDYPDLQALSRACSWIANDCTHYERRHPDYGLEDLKLFLDGVVSLIDLRMAISAAEAFVKPRD